MIMAAKPISDQLAPAMLVICTGLVAWSWKLRPEGAVIWATTMLLLAGMALVLFVAVRRSTDQTRGDQVAREIRNGVLWAGLMLAVTLVAKLVSMRGSADLSERANMVVLGAFLVFTGNAIPKTIAYLPALPGDAARVQGLRRFAGWTWVLTGLASAIVWLLLPIDVAWLVSMVLFPASTIAIVAQIMRSRRARHGEA